MSSGRIVQVIGAVVDVEFERNEVPKVYDALRVTDAELTLEVQQQLGDGVVRAIAMGASEGLSRGLAVENTGAPITIPVGQETLGRIMNVLGEPIDEKGPVNAADSMPIHRSAPTYEDQSGAVEILETGIKVIDLVCLTISQTPTEASAPPETKYPYLTFDLFAFGANTRCCTADMLPPENVCPPSVVKSNRQGFDGCGSKSIAKHSTMSL